MDHQYTHVTPSDVCLHRFQAKRLQKQGCFNIRILGGIVFLSTFISICEHSSVFFCSPAYQELEPTGEMAAAVVAEPLEGPSEEVVSSPEEPAADLLQRFFNVSHLPEDTAGLVKPGPLT